MTTTVSLRRLAADDWLLYREVRLAALAEAPRAFGSGLAREQAFTEPEWRLRAAGSTVALDNGGRPVGMVGWHRPDPGGPAELVAMWVAPTARGLGVGEALVRAVLEQVDGPVALGVVETNVAALDLYRRCGFEVVGREIGTSSGDPLLRMHHEGAS